MSNVSVNLRHVDMFVLLSPTYIPAVFIEASDVGLGHYNLFVASGVEICYHLHFPKFLLIFFVHLQSSIILMT